MEYTVVYPNCCHARHDADDIVDMPCYAGRTAVIRVNNRTLQCDPQNMAWRPLQSGVVVAAAICIRMSWAAVGVFYLERPSLVLQRRQSLLGWQALQ